MRARLADEAGMTLIEVMTSALLLVIISLGVTKGIDAASNASGMSKQKSAAAALAQQDQERLRTLTSANLSKFNGTRTQTVRGVPFTIVSRSKWISDSSGTESCSESGADGDDEASYMRITSTVTWPDMRGMKPVVATSLVAPPNGSFGDQGSLLIEIVDRNGAGLSGVGVTVTPLSGTGSALTETTGAQGCAFFGFLPPINYRVTFGKVGYVDTQGVQAVTKDVGVTAAATNRASFQYDQASTLNVNVVTRKYGAASDIAAKTEYVTLGHSGLAAPSTRLFGSATGIAMVAATPLFPFTSAYAVYSGNCTGADPALNGQAGYFHTALPGAAPNMAVREVAGFFDGAGVNTIDGVRLTAKSTGCGGSVQYGVASGHMDTPDKSAPFGVYDICVHRTNGSTSPNRRSHLEQNFAFDSTTGEHLVVSSNTNSYWDDQCW